MATSAAIQTLLAAFIFGILVQAVLAALFLFVTGHGTNIFRDGRRLVLMLFLLFTGLWAQVSFFNLMVKSASPTACQVLLVFTTTFDQTARVVMEQFLLWALGQGTKVTAHQLVLQGILAARLIVGGVLVGFTRPDFAPVCVARTSQMAVDITVLALDGILIGAMMIRAFSSGMLRHGEGSIQRDQGKAFILIIAGFAVWTAVSIPMTLGFPTVALVVRTVLPAIGLLILVGVAMIFSGILLSPKEEEMITPEARSPFVAPTPPSREFFKDNLGNGSPVTGHNYTKSGKLFVVNPSATPRDSPTTRFQVHYQGDTRGFTKLGEEVRVRAFGGDGLGDKSTSNALFSAALTTPLQAGNQVMAVPNARVAPDKVRNISASAVAAPLVKQKTSLFGWSKAPVKTPVRNLGISRPVMENSEDEAIKPFARMATIDLATAAVNERERREGTLAKSLVANRPAPNPPSFPPAHEGLRKSISLKRKVAPPSHPAQPMPVIASSNSSNLSASSLSSSTTATSLSPGREEVRRRSPRNEHSFDKLTDEKPLSRPSFRRKPTTGLPMNPKSQRMAVASQTGRAKEQTVMFLNDIVYDNPAVVKTIIDGAPDMYTSTKRPKTAGKVLDGPTTNKPDSFDSILHRPRPIKRDSEKDRILFPSEPSPGHRRSRSATSIGLRKSLLAYHPGSPTELPPLPPPPTSAMRLRRLLPSDTKSMTFNEKIELLFPAPPGIPTIPDRRSSVPSLPRISSTLLLDLAEAENQAGNKHQSTASKRTTIGLFGPLDLGDRPTSPNQELARAGDRQTNRISADNYKNIADEVGETWIPGIPATEVDILNPVLDAPQRESGFETRKSSTTDATTSSMSSGADSVTYWGSIHSELPPVDLSKARRTARSTFMQRPESDPSGSGTTAVPPVPLLEKDHKKVSLAVGADLGESRRPLASQLAGARTSFLLDADQAWPENNNFPPQNTTGWHRRIGDELPTFSERRSNSRARKMPPPTPLLLNKNGRKATVLLHAAEPSPISPPERAIEEIQAQLKRFEDSSRDLPDSSDSTSAEDDQVIKSQLLENLEKEMGLQESQWQQMQNSLDRDSMSVVMSAHEETLSGNGIDKGSFQASSRAPSRATSRRARIRSSMTRSRGQDSTSTVSTLSSDNSRASIWQQRLAEAQVEYLEKAPALRNQSMNFLSASSHHQQIGSPTPPESVDSESDLETDLGLDGFTIIAPQMPKPMAQRQASLWSLPVPSPKAASGRLWDPPHEDLKVRVVSPKLPAGDIRPKARGAGNPLKIRSFSLWTQPHSVEQRHAVTGLWHPKTTTRPRRSATLRATKRPQRKSRRITFLPDIVESPTPLPDKRDTLGIFQFPWGEQSDSAVYQPVFNPTALGAPLLNASLQARSRQLEPESNGYSSSFFDDYDEEHDDDDFDVDSDDDFDETTLWEIANLLQSTDVPSRNSLLPPSSKLPPISDIIEDYDDESDTENTAQDDLGQVTQTKPFLGVQLWSQVNSVDLPENAISLPQPDKNIWKALVAPTEGVTRSKPRTPEVPHSITSYELWTIPKASRQISGILDISSQSLWSPEPSNHSMMWTPTKPELEVVATGLFKASPSRSSYRTTTLLPPSASILRKPRATNKLCSELEFNRLWSGHAIAQPEHHSISESSIRPDSPSIYSSPSSGESSPASDASSIKSSSSKASSLWGSIGSAASSVVPWWDRKHKNTSPSHSPQGNHQNSSKPPASSSSAKSTESTAKPMMASKIPAPIKPLESIRESMVLVRRNTSAVKAPTLENTPTKNLRRPGTAQPPVSLTCKPLRHQYRPTIALHADWDAALAEAISASTPKKTLTRPKATRSDWTAALNAAIMASQSLTEVQQTSLNVWGDTLNQAIFRSYDPSSRHPVFFADKLISKSADIHPAAIGYVIDAPLAQTHMWSQPINSPALKAATLWSKGTLFKRESKAHTSVFKPEPSRRVRMNTPLVLPALESSSRWVSTQNVTFQRSSSTIANKMNNNQNMWSAQRPAIVTRREHFGVSAEYMKESASLRAASISHPTSSQFPGLAFDTNSKSIHWLHATSKLPETSNLPMISPVTNIRSQAWTNLMTIVPVKQTAPAMWVSRALPSYTSPALFPNPHKAAWDRKKTKPDDINTIESTEMWRPSMAIPQSPKNWLVKRRFSKVEFRY